MPAATKWKNKGFFHWKKVRAVIDVRQCIIDKTKRTKRNETIRKRIILLNDIRIIGIGIGIRTIIETRETNKTNKKQKKRKNICCFLNKEKAINNTKKDKRSEKGQVYNKEKKFNCTKISIAYKYNK